jgi:acyl-homoserine lactone acylase PvdQ
MSLTEDSRERNASRASLLFHAWIVRLVESVFADEMSALGLNLHDLTAISPTLPIRSSLYLLERQPSALGTFDGDLGDSLLWDDLTTKRLECRDDRLVNAWLDAVDWLESHLGSDPNWWRWGLVHTARFTPLDASMDALTFPALSDVNFRHGFPRQGGLFTVDGGGFDLLQPMNEAPRFPEISGASLRMTMRYGAKGPEAVVALAGGQQADPSAPHFRDSAESWRHNTTHALVHRLDDVLSRARSREVAWSP